MKFRNQDLACHWHWVALLLTAAVVLFWALGLPISFPLAALFGWEIFGVWGHYWLRTRDE